MTGPPLVLLDGPPDLLALHVRDVAREGWSVVRGWTLPAEPWDLRSRRLLCAGEVGDEQAASQALLCAVRGTGILAAVTADESVRRRFEEDLRHLGPVQRRRGAGPAGAAVGPNGESTAAGSGTEAPAEAGESRAGPAIGRPGPAAGLDEDQVRLLRLLAEGLSVPEAAKACLLSQRTAERRLSAARRVLGVASTAEALVEWRRRDSG